jgi:hypothetical protein
VTSIYRLIVGVGVTLLVALSATPAVASVHVWTDAVNTLWSNAGNWTGGVPATGEPGGTTVQFGSGTSSTMDIPGLTVDQIHFTGSGNTITGSTALNVNGSTLVTNILDGSGGNTLALPVALPGGTAVLADVTAEPALPRHPRDPAHQDLVSATRSTVRDCGRSQAGVPAGPDWEHLTAIALRVRSLLRAIDPEPLGSNRRHRPDGRRRTQTCRGRRRFAGRRRHPPLASSQL